MDTQTQDTQIQEAIGKAVSRLNEMLDADNRLSAEPDTVLAGSDGRLDSMGLINLLLFAEEELGQALGRPVDIMSTVGDRAASSAAFTIGELIELVRQTLAR